MFRSLGLHPGSGISTSAVAALAGLDIAPTRSVLRSLAEVHLIEPVTPDRYHLHDLLRVFAAERAASEEAADHAANIQARLLGWYAHTASRACDLVFPGILHLRLNIGSPPHPPLELTSHTQALNWLDAERVNLIAAVHHAAKQDFPHLVMHLVDVIQVFLVSRAHRDDLRKVHALALTAAQTIGDKTCEGWFQFYRGWAFSQMFEWDGARDPLQCALVIAKDLRDESMQAWAMTALGWGFLEQQRYVEAFDQLKPALRLSQRGDSRRLESVVQEFLSRTHARLGDHQLARAHAERALALRPQAGDREGDTYAIHQLALVWQGMGDHQKAIELCTQALDIARTCAAFPLQTAATLDTMAISLHHSGSYSQALACLSKAVDIYDEFGTERAAPARRRLEALQASAPEVE